MQAPLGKVEQALKQSANGEEDRPQKPGFSETWLFASGS